MGRTQYARMMAFAVVVMLALACAIGLALWRLREDAILDTTRAAGNIATILAEQASHSTQAIELVIDEMIEDVARRDFGSRAHFNDYMRTQVAYRYIMERLTRLPQADVISFTDHEGNLVRTTRGWPVPNVNISDRDYFQKAKQSADLGLFVSVPVQNKVTQTWTVFFSKRIETRTGEFLGTVLIGVRPEFFMRTFDVISLIPGQSLLLLRRDGTVLLRHPDPVARAGGKMPADSGWYQAVEQGSGSYRSAGVFDNEPRWVGVRPLARYPLVVDVAVAESYALSVWRSRAIVIGTCSLIAGLVLAFLLRALYLQFEKLRVSESRLAEKSEEASVANMRFDAALSHMSHGVAMYDRDGKLLIHNRQYEQIWGMSAEDLRPGIAVSDIIASRAARGLYMGPAPKTYLDRPDVSREGRFATVQTLSDGRSVRINFDPMPDGGWVTTHEDITERQRVSEKIEHMAHHDALTDLSNRTLFMSRLEDFIRPGSGPDFAVLLVDLDRFKEVNDTFGHGVGDVLLKQVAARLKSAVRGHDIVARLGGDEFAILRAMDSAGLEGLSVLAKRLLNRIRESYFIEGHEVTIGLSIGITIGHPGADDPERIMRQADLALYRAKADGRGRYKLFESEMEEQIQSRRQLAVDLQGAISRGDLLVHYQPIVDAASCEVRSMEALVRWPHPVRGFVSPVLFIPLAEEAGLIHRLGEFVLIRACRDALAWPDEVKVAVNVSALQVGQGTFPSIVGRVLRETGLRAGRLKLEITESVLLSDGRQALSILHDLRKLGVSIVLDDFGTGFSSLSYLKMFPFDEIKIDKSFVDDIAVHSGCAAIVSATTTLARAFDIITTAEGVETEEQYRLLRAASVTQMQGYLFGKPGPAEAWDFSQKLGLRA